MLKLKIDPEKVKNVVLVRPDMPKQGKLLDANLLEQNQFQETAKPTNKIEHKQLQEAKKKELFLRQLNESDRWETIFGKTVGQDFRKDEDNEIGNLMIQFYEDMTGDEISQCKLSYNFARWAKAVQLYWFDKCGESADKVKRFLGDRPKVKLEAAVKPKLGDVRALVLPGEGTFP